MKKNYSMYNQNKSSSTFLFYSIISNFVRSWTEKVHSLRKKKNQLLSIKSIWAEVHCVILHIDKDLSSDFYNFHTSEKFIFSESINKKRKWNWTKFTNFFKRGVCRQLYSVLTLSYVHKWFLIMTIEILFKSWMCFRLHKM